MNDARDLEPAHKIDYIVTAGHIQSLDEGSFADFVFDKVRFPPHTVLSQHDFLSRVQKASRRVQADKP
jgi:hypothetical protein